MRKTLLVALVACLLGCAHAEARGKSVYHVSPWLDGSVITATSLGSIVPALYGNHLIDFRCPCNPTEVNAFDRHVIGNDSQTARSISDVTLGISILGPPLLDYLTLGANRQLVEDYFVYAEVLSVSGAFVTLAKYTVQRPIPRLYAGQDPGQLRSAGGYGSFYSGHVDLSVSALSAMAVTTDLRYHWGVWPWLVTGAVGLSVAAERVLGGEHFYTDVGMGMLAGTLFGAGIPLLHKADSPKQQISVSRVSDGFSVSWTHLI